MLCAESVITILLLYQSIGNEQKCHFGLSGLKITSTIRRMYNVYTYSTQNSTFFFFEILTE